MLPIRAWALLFKDKRSHIFKTCLVNNLLTLILNTLNNLIHINKCILSCFENFLGFFSPPLFKSFENFMRRSNKATRVCA